MFRDPKMTTALLDRLTYHGEIVETGNESWCFKKPLSKPKPKSPISRTWFALCNPGQCQATQVLIVNGGVIFDAD